ncbi:MAG: purine-binding chemotaxis protein CheW [Nitrospinae bacterium]|nr:purine-binding chemotaxis protein CheW [Nitrospinota bacterium]
MSEQIDKTKSERIAEEVKKRSGQKQIVDVEEKKVKLVIFTLNDSYYAFHGEDVKEILPLAKIYFVPGSPEFILGIVNVRGDIQSVLDIKNFMGLSGSKRTEASRIVIAERNGVRSGVIVDSVEDVLDVPESSIQRVISTLSDHVKFFVAGETEYKNRNVTLLDVGKVFEKISSD